MSPKDLQNISNFEGWSLTLVAYKKKVGELLARVGNYPNQVLKHAATHLKFAVACFRLVAVYLLRRVLKWKMKYMIFYFLYFGQYFITNSQKNIWWKHAVTSLGLLLIFIRFQNNITLKFNFKRLRKWKSDVPFRRSPAEVLF